MRRIGRQQEIGKVQIVARVLSSRRCAARPAHDAYRGMAGKLPALQGIGDGFPIPFFPAFSV